MKYAIIADIHGNLEAFQTVLKDAEENQCTHYACLSLRLSEMDTASVMIDAAR